MARFFMSAAIAAAFFFGGMPAHAYSSMPVYNGSASVPPLSGDDCGGNTSAEEPHPDSAWQRIGYATRQQMAEELISTPKTPKSLSVTRQQVAEEPYSDRADELAECLGNESGAEEGFAGMAEGASRADSTYSKVYNIGEVVVTGTRNEADIRHLPMTVTVVGRDIIKENNIPSLLPVLTEQVPGLFTTARGIMGYGVSGGAAGTMTIRGISGGSGQLMVLIDGHPQYMGIMGHPIADAYQSAMAEKVEVLRGPASVLYGSNAMGGVINIVTRKMEEDGVRTGINAGFGSFNTFQSEITNMVRKRNFSSAAGFSYNHTDGHRANMDFSQYSGFIKLGYDISPNWKVSADANLMHFDASNPGTVWSPLLDADQGITRGTASFAIENEYERTSGAVSVFYNWGRHRINDGYTADPGDDDNPKEYRFNSYDMMAGVSVYQSARMFKGNRLTVGADYFRFGGSAWNRFLDGHSEDIVDQQIDEFAAYLDFRQSISGWMTFDAGIRADYRGGTGLEWIPQAGFSFHIDSGIDLKLMASKGFRNPTIKEMYMWGAANPDLEPERLWTYELSFSQKLLQGRLHYGINLFYINGNNMIITSYADGRPLNSNIGRIRNSGVEAQASFRISGSWSVDANYSFLHMENPVLAAPEHKLYAGAMFMSGRWMVSTGVQYVHGLYTSVDPVEKENFVLWNIRASVSISDNVGLWARGENLLDCRYQINSGFPMPGASLMIGTDISF